MIDEKKRRQLAGHVVDGIRRQQALGLLPADLEPGYLLLALRSLAVFPVAFPQLTRFFTGQPASDPHFQTQYTKFLEKFAAAFHPSSGKTRQNPF